VKLPILLFYVLLVFISCRKEDAGSCDSEVFKSIYNFPKGNALFVEFSPIRKGNILISIGDTSKVEIDIYTGKQQQITGNNYKILNYYKNIYHQDQFDSIVYIAGPQDVYRYDQRTDTYSKLPIKYVCKIVSRQDGVYFAERNGLSRLDRKSGSIINFFSKPELGIVTAQLPTDSTIILGDKFTYNFNSKQVKEGVWFGSYRHTGDFSTYESGDYGTLFRKSDSLFLYKNGNIHYLLIPYPNIQNTTVIDNQIWQENNKVVLQYNISLKKWWDYKISLPEVNNESVNYSFNGAYIWAFRADQLMLIDTNKGIHYQYPLKSGDGFKMVIYDKCNVFLLYNNKLEIVPMSQFIIRCKPFDFNKYKKQFEDYQRMVYQTCSKSDTSVAQVKSKLKAIELKFGMLDNVDIQNDYDYLKFRLISSMKLSDVSDFHDCIYDPELSPEQQVKCLEKLLDIYVLGGKYKEGAELEPIFKSKIKLKFYLKEGLKTKFDSLNRYLSTNYELSKIKMSPDSLLYLKAMSLKSISHTLWYCSEGCAGCDMHLVTDKLTSFLKKYPKSKLCDDAMMYIEMDGFDYMDDDLPQFIDESKIIKSVLMKYSDSNIATEHLNNFLGENSSLYFMSDNDFTIAYNYALKQFPGMSDKLKIIKAYRLKRKEE